MQLQIEHTTYEENERVLTSLISLDRDAWAKAYSEAARPYEERAEEAEERGDRQAAMENYLHAHALYRMARFPTTNSPGKMEAYRKSVQAFLKAAHYFDPPQERVEIPFRGKPGEGDMIVGYLRRPKYARVPTDSGVLRQEGKSLCRLPHPPTAFSADLVYLLGWLTRRADCL